MCRWEIVSLAAGGAALAGGITCYLLGRPASPGHHMSRRRRRLAVAAVAAVVVGVAAVALAQLGTCREVSLVRRRSY